MAAINNGNMNYTRIDANALDVGFIVPGGGASNNAFPSFKATDKKTNRVNITVAMPQNSLKADALNNNDPDYKIIVQNKKIFEQVRQELLAAEAKACLYPQVPRNQALAQAAHWSNSRNKLGGPFGQASGFQEEQLQGLFRTDFLGLKPLTSKEWSMSGDAYTPEHQTLRWSS